MTLGEMLAITLREGGSSRIIKDGELPLFDDDNEIVIAKSSEFAVSIN